MFSVVALLTAIPLFELQLYISTIVCAVIPFGLGLTIILRRLFAASQPPPTSKHPEVLRHFATSTAAQIVIVSIGIAVTLVWQFPLPIQPVHSIAIALVLLPIGLLLSATAMAKVTVKPLTQHIVYTALIQGALIAGLTLANYYLFFKRSHLIPELVPVGSVEQVLAASVAVSTLVLCMVVQLFTFGIRRAEYKTASVWISSSIVLFSLLNLLYNPWVASVAHTTALSWLDLGYSAMAATLYGLLVVFYRHNKKHSRKVVLNLHRQHRIKP